MEIYPLLFYTCPKKIQMYALGWVHLSELGKTHQKLPPFAAAAYITEGIALHPIIK